MLSQSEAARPPASNVEEQLRRFDRFREDFNASRKPQRPPAAFCRPSQRRYPERLGEP